MPIRWHADDPDLLAEAIAFTARQTGFNPRLVEKDYFCSVVLEHLAASDVRHGGLVAGDRALLDLVRRKLLVPGTAEVDVSPGRVGQLRGQLEPELRPVLREQDFVQFRLERAVEMVRTFARQLG